MQEERDNKRVRESKKGEWFGLERERERVERKKKVILLLLFANANGTPDDGVILLFDVLK